MKTDDALSDEAIEWLVRLDAERSNQAARDAFAGWRDLSPQHEAAAREAENLWNGLPAAGRRVRQTDRRSALTRRAAIGGVLLTGAGFGLVRSGLIRFDPFSDYVTDVGEQKVINLADGSTVQLNARSALSVYIEDRLRRVRLVEGQATFTVAKDSRRPFVVEAGTGRSTAIGTIFDVDIARDVVEVTVVEGAVSVESGSTSSAKLGANRRIRYTDDGTLLAPEDVDANIELAWRRGKLIFNGRRLADVVNELERYRPGRVIIAGEGLRNLQVTGVFDVSDPASIVSTIRDALPVRVTELPLVTIIRSI
ncbi:FecR family protein [Rhizobium sp. S152]|uniref:FecR family protein n=1 Tax=Rhizobium sp. S152 TaxID=3055038 RepID=UPI0025A9C645|nr:FecR family protein [Rhizobium sp. S152]MDM9627704.1 FecR family protein [Rhizobium sp. S152]